MKKRIIFMLLTLALALVILPAAASAQTNGAQDEVLYAGECGAEGSNVTWALYESGLLKISGEGAMPDGDYESDQIPWNHLDEDITEVIIEPGVTLIS